MKKVLALVLAVALVFGMSTVAFAKITNPRVALGGSLGDSLAALTWAYKNPANNYDDVGRSVSKAADTDATEVWANINDLFTKTSYSTSTGTSPSKSDLSHDNIGIGYRIVKGGDIISKVELDSNEKARIVFKKNITLTKNVDWEVDMWLTFDRTRNDDTKVTLSGTYSWEKNVAPVQEVNADDSYIYTGDGIVVKATEYVRNIEVDLGHDISIVTKLFESKKYMGWATEKIETAEANMMDKYPDIDNVYTIYQSGLSGTGNIVKFGMSDTFYAYTDDGNGDLKYLGKTSSNLPYAPKYYLASKELNIKSAVADVVDEAPTASGTKNAPTGGDDVVVVNSNFNPGTGR